MSRITQGPEKGLGFRDLGFGFKGWDCLFNVEWVFGVAYIVTRQG